MDAQAMGHEDAAIQGGRLHGRGPAACNADTMAAMVAYAPTAGIDVLGNAPFDIRPALTTTPASADDSLPDLLGPVLGTMRMGAVIVNVDARVVYLNDAGKEAVCGDIGLALRGDRLVATANDGRRKLAQALNGACRPPFIDGAVLLGPARGTGVTRPLRVLSMERIAGRTQRSDAGLALLCIASGRQRAPDASMLAQLFGLTAAESSLMAGIAGGERLHQCARRRGVSLATVRAQLRNVFVKTGAATQADLTFIAWSIPGLWIN